MESERYAEQRRGLLSPSSSRPNAEVGTSDVAARTDSSPDALGKECGKRLRSGDGAAAWTGEQTGHRRRRQRESDALSETRQREGPLEDRRARRVDAQD